MKRVTILIVFLFILTSLSAQEFEIPSGYQFKKIEDYATFQKEAIAAADWLSATPVDQQTEKRRDVNAFLLKWLSGTPAVSININADMIKFGDCADCLLVFMGSWAKSAIENNAPKNNYAGNLAGLEGVIRFYQKNKAVSGKNKAIDKFIKLKEKGKLESFIKSKT